MIMVTASHMLCSCGGLFTVLLYLFFSVGLYMVMFVIA